MINLYCTLIINKRKTFDEVPGNLKEAVRERLEELGFGTNGDPIS